MSKKEKKQNQLSKRTLIHLNAIKNIYKVDMEKRTITVPLHYSSPADIVEEDVGDKAHPCIKRDLLARFSDIIHNLPDEFKINIDLKIEDYQGYQHSHLKTALLNALESFQYDDVKHKTTSQLKVVLLTIVGITIFALLYYLCAKNLFGPQQESDPTHNTIHEILFSLAGSFLFEDVLLLFMPEKGYGDINDYILYRINVLRFLNKKNKALSSIRLTDFCENSHIQSRRETRVKWLFLICGTIFLTIAAVEIIDIVEAFAKIGTLKLAWLMCVQSILTVAFCVLAGIGTISYYKGKGKLRKLVIPFGIIAGLVAISQIVMSSILLSVVGTRAIKRIVFGAIILVIAIWYTISAFWLNKKDKQKKVSL